MSLVFIKDVAKDTRLGLWRVEESIEELEKNLILNEKERSFFNSLNKGIRNLHWLSSRLLIRKMINTPEFIEIENDAYGKPQIINFDYELSISHSFDYASVILSKNKSGVDIELISNKILKIAHKFINESESKYISNDYQIEQMYVIWGAKESLYKLYGKKNLNFKKNINIYPFKLNSKKASIKGEIINNELRKIYTIHYERIDEYMLVYVVDSEKLL